MGKENLSKGSPYNVKSKMNIWWFMVIQGLHGGAKAGHGDIVEFMLLS